MNTSEPLARNQTDEPRPRFAPPSVAVEHRANGAVVVRSPVPLGAHDRCVGDWLRVWAGRAPERAFLAERAPEGWRTLRYGEALEAAQAIGAALLERSLSAERPVAILSDNSIDHALLALGAQLVGIPYAPISPAYSLLSSDFRQLRSICELLDPGLVFVDDAAKYAAALGAICGQRFELVASRNGPSGSTAFASLRQTSVSPAVSAASAAVGPDTVAKLLFTSGSTGSPKGVVNTHRMLCSNQQAIRQVWPFLVDEPPVFVDWLPWNHTFGGNHNFNLVLANGGTLYLDDGKPVPGLAERTVANLREIAPTLYFNVPRGFDVLLDFLEADPALADHFYSRLTLIFYAGAGLPAHLWARLERLAEPRGSRAMLVSAWGSTETAPGVTVVHFPIPRAGIIGLPLPGCELLLVPNGEKLEMRVRGPNITPGYWKRADLNREVFDDEGFYRTGDAGRFADPDDPTRGIEFDGRVAENFKLMSGTWVHVGALRVQAVAALAPVAQDVVVTGHDRETIGLLIFPNAAGCRSLCPEVSPTTPLEMLVGHRNVRERVMEGMRALAAAGGGSSTYPTRAVFATEPPSIDANEITDKGYINQRAVLARRAALVETLHVEPLDKQVITVAAAPTAARP